MTRREPLILLYHRVVDLDADPYGLAVGPTNFAEQLAVLGERTRVVPLTEARTGHTVITFDDGYEDNLLQAVPALTAAGLPATFFISSGAIGTDSEMWWDRLEGLLLTTEPKVPWLDLGSHGIRMWADVRGRDAAQRTFWALFWRLRPLPVDVITALLNEIGELLGVDASARATHRMMSAEQLNELSRAGFEVGAHTVTHPFLAAQPSGVQQSETSTCKSALEQMAGAPVTSFSYPFGGPDAVTPETVKHVHSAGYTRACLVGVHSPAGLSQLELPRFVVGDWNGDEFDRQLNSWLRR